MTTLAFKSQLHRSIEQFSQAGAQTKLVILHYLAQKLYRASDSATPSAFFSQKVQTVLKQLQQLPRADRHEALEEILHGIPTRLTEVYSELDTNMRMAFWYRLANSHRGEALLAQQPLSSWNPEQHVLLSELETCDCNELIAFLREAVAAKELTAIA